MTENAESTPGEYDKASVHPSRKWVHPDYAWVKVSNEDD